MKYGKSDIVPKFISIFGANFNRRNFSRYKKNSIGVVEVI